MKVIRTEMEKKNFSYQIVYFFLLFLFLEYEFHLRYWMYLQPVINIPRNSNPYYKILQNA